ncbi:MAG: HlyC/CorC family transporter [Deltaproteobacteria bacterium]|nr:HlyC/CorC family transporter [Deltaproteobacteria bacterium]MCW5804581.1 HlyC/CorC family transporter [Deltaproteobacteria bacterium]
MTTEFLIVFALLLVNGLFAGAEIAILSVRKTRLREFIRRRDKSALAVKSLRDHPERFLATVQICITLAGTAAAAYGGARLEHTLGAKFESVGIPPALALAAVIVIIVILELVVGELVPKSLALRYSDRYSFLTARPLLFIAWILRPVVWFLTKMSNLVLRFFGDRTTFTEARLSRDELQQLVEEAAKTGSVDPRASEIASRALGFGEVTVAEVMVPRTRVVALRRGAPADEVQRVILEEGHSRMPVYDGSIDNIVGYVVARDVLALAWEKHLIVLEDILRPAHKVPESTRALDLLREMQRNRTQMALVVDDNGGLSGLVTTEDLIEELVGDIMSEDDVPEQFFTREPSGTILVQGWAAVRKVNRDLHLDLPVGKDRTTIAGLCMALAQAIPQAGERLTTDNGTVLEVIEASPRRVRRVRIHPVAQHDEAESTPEDKEV